MIAALALLAASSFHPVPVPEAIRQRTEICRVGLIHWDAGDGDWMEREMRRLRLSEADKQGQRMVCLVYLQGAVDALALPAPQGRGEAGGDRHEQAPGEAQPRSD